MVDEHLELAAKLYGIPYSADNPRINKDNIIQYDYYRNKAKMVSLCLRTGCYNHEVIESLTKSNLIDALKFLHKTKKEN